MSASYKNVAFVFFILQHFQSAVECGRILWITECRHSKPITVVKRAKNLSDKEIFVSGGADGKINLWRLVEHKLQHILTIGPFI